MNNLVELSIPTPSNMAEERAAATLESSRAMTITSPQQYTAGADELKAIKGKWREIDEARKDLVKPIDEARKRIQAFFAKPLSYLEQSESIIKGKLVEYQNEQERIRREAQRKAEDAARKEREKLEAAAREIERKAREKAEADRKAAEAAAAAGRSEESAKLAARADAAEAKAADKAEQMQARAASVVAPIVQREAPKVSGIKTRDVMRFEVTNPALVPREYLSINETAIRGVVNSLKMDTKIPGVRVWVEKSVASGTA